MQRTTLAVIAALACASAPLVIGQASARKANTPSPSSRLDAFVGDGICIGHQLPQGKPPGPAKHAHYHGELSLDGHWLVMHYDEERTATNPRPFHATQYIGHDAAGKRFVTVLFTNFSGRYSTGTSTGWLDNTLSFDEPDSNGVVSARDVFTTGESGMASHTGMERDQHGRWIRHDVETCHKT